MGTIVTSYDGHEAAVRPRTLLWEGQRYRVVEVIAQSRTVDGKHFRVRTEAGQVFDLVYTISTGEWQIRQT